MKYSHYCKYTCCFCKGKLKQKTTKYVRKTGIFKKKKLTTFSCNVCTEQVYSAMELANVNRSKFEMAFITATGKPFAYEIAVEGYRILLYFATNRCFVSRSDKKPGFNSMGQKITNNYYVSAIQINSIPKLDLTDPKAILRKIKLLLTFS